MAVDIERERAGRDGGGALGTGCASCNWSPIGCARCRTSPPRTASRAGPAPPPPSPDLGPLGADPAADSDEPWAAGLLRVAGEGWEASPPEGDGGERAWLAQLQLPLPDGQFLVARGVPIQPVLALPSTSGLAGGAGRGEAAAEEAAAEAELEADESGGSGGSECPAPAEV